VPVALVLIDLDEFKQVNDSAGHAGGDQTLASFGKLVARVLRKVDRPFRVGGDEFAILLPHTDADGGYIVARRLLVAALQPTVRDPKVKPLSFSAGVSSLPGLAGDRSELYTQADAALYAAKRAGRTEVLVYDPSEEVAATDASASAAIADVIARNLLRPVFQPIVDLSTGGTLGYEGLIRPIAPAPYTDPASLFAAAEASGHVVPLDLACVEAIVAAATRLPKELFLSVNLSPRTVEAPEFSAAAMLSILARHSFPPDRLVIELTEHQPIADIGQVRHKLDACRGAGMRLAADDLGAGNAGLRLLSDLRFDIVKVDLGLVQRSSPGAPSSAVVESIVAFASRTGALVIGEGVEHEEQVEQLTQLGVTAAQGYLFSRPGPLPEWAAEPRLVDLVYRHEAEPAVVADTELEAWKQSIGLVTPAA
jgi:diguanylate cyclase (GGDEF)-like protein